MEISSQDILLRLPHKSRLSDIQRLAYQIPSANSISFFLEIFEMNSQFPSMLFRNSEGAEKDTLRPRLSALEIEAIEMFINFLKIVGLQKSIGEIYGLLFVSAKPLSMDDIVNRLGISLGAASQGLKILRAVGAVKSVYSPRDRRDHFAADLELSKFATVFIKEELRPRVERALQRIQHMESLLAEYARRRAPGNQASPASAQTLA